MKTLRGFSVLLFITLSGIVRAQIYEWEALTPGGNRMDDAKGYTSLQLTNGITIDYLGQWYFYKNHIIVKPNEYKSNIESQKFLIINENTLEIDSFTTMEGWNEAINLKHLKPNFWTRWHDKDWDDGIEGLLLIIIMYFFFSVPVTVILIAVTYKGFTKHGVNFKKGHTYIPVIIAVLFLYLAISSHYPQSI